MDSGLDIRGCQDPRAPLNSPAAPSNFCREPKGVLYSKQNTFRYLLKMQLGSQEKSFIWSPGIIGGGLIDCTYIECANEMKQFSTNLFIRRG